MKPSERNVISPQLPGAELMAPTGGNDDYGLKSKHSQPYLDVPLDSASLRSLDTSFHGSRHSADDGDGTSWTGSLLAQTESYPLASRSPLPASSTWKARLQAFWTRNKGLVLVIISQIFGVMMSVTTKFLETSDSHSPAMHPLQILFARMIGTLILSVSYQRLAKIEHAPFGSKEVWPLLIARGVGGFFGVFGMYYSLQYLALSDATVITFLAPILTSYTCSILIHEPFTRSEQIAGVISFLGVVFIARPTSLIPNPSSNTPAASGAIDSLASTNVTGTASDPQGMDKVTPSQRLSGVAMALVGVFGAVCAYTTIRWIGKRAHPLISVNYLATWSIIVSTIALLTVPNIGFALPASLHQWIYLIFLGICGFIMQFLLTAGLAYEKGSRATNMVYTQMLFATAFDKLIWNTTPGIMSIAGSSLILGSALYVALLNNQAKEQEARDGDLDEELALVSGGDDEDSGSRDGRGPLGGVQEVQLRTLRV